LGRLGDSLSKKRLCLPLIVTDGGCFPVATCCAPLVTHVVSASAAASAHYMDGFALAFPLRWSTFTHTLSPYLGGGEINTTLSPRTIIKPSFLWLSTLEVSSVSSSTKFRCWSKPLSLPLRLLPPLSRTNTILPIFCSRISVVISLILKPFVTNILSLYLNLSHLNLPSKMGLHTHPHNHFPSCFFLECYSISKAKLREECFKNVFPLRPFAQRRLSS